MNKQDYINHLKAEGYDPVFVWDAEPNEDDPDHAHDFMSKLVILTGSITIGIAGAETTLTEGQSIIIPRGIIHSGLVGVEGCKYIVGEKH